MLHVVVELDSCCCVGADSFGFSWNWREGKLSIYNVQINLIKYMENENKFVYKFFFYILFRDLLLVKQVAKPQLQQIILVKLN